MLFTVGHLFVLKFSFRCVVTQYNYHKHVVVQIWAAQMIEFNSSISNHAYCMNRSRNFILQLYLTWIVLIFAQFTHESDWE